jgi:hypothetical protein
MRRNENKIEEVRQTCAINEGGINKVEAEAEKLTAKAEMQRRMIEKAAETAESDICAELTER